MYVASIFGYYEYIEINAFITGSIAIGIISGAYSTEVFRGAIQSIDKGQFEAANVLGLNKFGKFFRIILPLSMPGVIGAVLIIFIPCIGDYITPKLVGGPEGLMIANMIQVQFSKANNAPLAAALSVTSLLIVGIISMFFVHNRGSCVQHIGISAMMYIIVIMSIMSLIIF